MTKELKSQTLAADWNLKDKLSIDGKTGVITPAEDFYESTLPEGLTLDQLKKFQKHDATVRAAATLAAGEIAHDHFKEHKDAQEVTMGYAVGHNTNHVFFNREDQKNPVRHVTDVVGAGDKGELKKVHTMLKGMFDEIDT